MPTPAMLTDMYEYTMVDAALHDGTAHRACVFEVFTRHLPSGRRYGVVAGLGRILEYVRDFRPSAADLAFLRDNGIVSRETIAWLENFRFSGTIRAYREGEMFFANSPVLQVEGTFAECTLLETVILSVLNFDCAIASAASRITSAAGSRPCADMGGRRAHEEAAIAASRSAIVGGFMSTANLAAAQRYGIPCIGTAAHAFTLVHDSERDAFESQIHALGVGTTLLTDTYNVEEAIRTAVEVAGPQLGGIRIDSGDLASMAQKARHQLDALGATGTKITVTNDLDEYAIAALATAPVDSYGVGTRLVTGSGHPTTSMVYKLVEREGSDGQMHPVSKKSFGKSTDGWRKRGLRAYEYGLAQGELVLAGTAEAVAAWDDTAYGETKDLSITAIDHGDIDESLTTRDALFAARDYHVQALQELPVNALSLSDGEPAIPTEVITLS
ncbi:nicotinate phosphoribosyltransferase [Alloscardovia macacae]|uniref:Nicotinate phosphoribosyltransferase n=1 Tax=Alloscardovia macacae TaxID=1160091 RepID=A0A1Y2SXT4_9BIFI|nr:nicotinate phosphoribosyltransferase [Alloscardovia macacae]OTA26597.1 nicotinate phosphoribosyltransferase [Alloscardovia macacae]OTA29017.1 nicotinate phosphoribosyltransferase [Alloscardovia macacae]